jgi:predicted nuclease of restriction endonuclease-like (RecB) superfamily
MGRPITTDNEYKKWLVDLKQRIRQSQIKASVRVNTALLELYWSIGADIIEKQAESKWGSGVISQLSKDLRDEFIEVKGFSKRNLEYMRQFYLFYRGAQIVHQLGAQSDIPPQNHQVSIKTEFPQPLGYVPWRHHVEIMTKSKSLDEALFYIHQTMENGWSRAVLLNFMQSNLYKTKGKAPNNFALTLPDPQSVKMHSRSTYSSTT